MTDYIKRSTAIESLKKEAAEMSESFEELGGEPGVYAEAYEDAANMLQDMPAADVAEVVRCKYCAYLGAPLSGGCYNCKKYMLPYCRPDDFCSYGEYQTNTGGNANVSD